MTHRTNIRSALTVAATAMVAITLGGTTAVAQGSDGSMRFLQGLYLSGALGAHTTDDADISGAGINVSNDTDADVAGLVGIGVDLGEPNLRIELEGGYRPSDVDSISGASGSGDVDALSFLANVFYDFGVSPDIDLYVGGGLGLAEVDYDGVTPVGATTMNDSDTGFAWQLGAGGAYALNDRLKVTLDYRFLNVEGLDIATSPSVGALDTDYRDHAIFVGLRFALSDPSPQPMEAPSPAPAPAAQAPAPQPAPAPAPAEPAAPRTFIVFFDWDQSAITAEAEGILREAAAVAQSSGPVRIVATGHADRSGPSDYNLGLSARRAAAVRTQLQTFGIDPFTVAIFARGETDPLVPTPDGVREPQNRRVELVLQ